MKSRKEIEDKIMEICTQDLSQSAGIFIIREYTIVGALKWVLEGE